MFQKDFGRRPRSLPLNIKLFGLGEIGIRSETTLKSELTRIIKGKIDQPLRCTHNRMAAIALISVLLPSVSVFLTFKHSRFETICWNTSSRPRLQNCSRLTRARQQKTPQFAWLRHFGDAPICRGKFVRPELVNLHNGHVFSALP